MAGTSPAMTERGNYFQPAALLHAACSVLWVFSHCVIDWVSLSLILLFMQVQYFSTTSFFAPSFLLSSTHWLIHFTSSVVAATAALLENAEAASRSAKLIDFIGPIPSGCCAALRRQTGPDRLDWQATLR